MKVPESEVKSQCSKMNMIDGYVGKRINVITGGSIVPIEMQVKLKYYVTWLAYAQPLKDIIPAA